MFSQAAEKNHKCDNNRRMKGLQFFCGMRSQIYLHRLCSLCDVLMGHKCEKKCFQKLPNFFFRNRGEHRGSLCNVFGGVRNVRRNVFKCFQKCYYHWKCFTCFQGVINLRRNVFRSFQKCFQKSRRTYGISLQCFPRSQKCVFSNLLLPSIN